MPAFNWRNRHGLKKLKNAKIEQTMHEFKEGELHSGSKTGPKVTNRRQAIAISLAQARRAGADIPPAGGRH